MIGNRDFAKAVRAVVRKAAALGFGPRHAFVLALGFYGAGVDGAAALPSYARQTGQPCSTCHTAFPQLTPFGRRFKLGGYTAEGGGPNGDSGSGGAILEPPLPLAIMVQSTFTHYNRGLDEPESSGGNYTVPTPNGGFPGQNNFVDLSQQASLFYGGKIYGNLGAFVQVTYSNDNGRVFSTDNTDIRYADRFRIFNTDVLWGLTANNNPSVQDVWNTTPAWSSPFITSNFSLSPVASTMIEGFAPGQTLGGGGYVFIDDTYYAELSAYGSLSPRAQLTLGLPLADQIGFAIQGLAPYYRIAAEPVWGDHSLMIGAYGMAANVTPQLSYGFGTDKIFDAGFDSQYQWISSQHAVTVRANYIFERQILNSSYAQNFSANPTDYLRSLKIGAEYVYDHTYSFTATYFQITGSPDAIVYSNNNMSSPNSAGWIFDVAYLPFSHGGPSLWPWLNTRLGVSYTLFTRFDGASNNIDPVNCPDCRNANNNNTLLLYAFTAF